MKKFIPFIIAGVIILITIIASVIVINIPKTNQTKSTFVEINNTAYDIENMIIVNVNELEESEVRYNAEGLANNAEKKLAELGDKINADEKAKIEIEIENVKKTLEGTDTESIKTATEKLTKVFYEVVGEELVIEEELQEIDLEEIKKEETKTVSKDMPFYIRVNCQAQVVNIYKKDDNNEYTVPVKAMVCSTGSSTPSSGVYKIPGRRSRWRALYGGVYGQYVTNIVGAILFHSVPYLGNGDSGSLEYWEYDKLGYAASMGCVRLTVKDAKWIYENCGAGTQVEFYYDSNPGPLGKPTARKIENIPECRDWDPTDPDPANPWKYYNPAAEEKKENENSNTQVNAELVNSVISINEINNNINIISNTTTNTIENKVVNETVKTNTVTNTTKTENTVTNTVANSANTNTTKNDSKTNESKESVAENKTKTENTTGENKTNSTANNATNKL